MATVVTKGFRKPKDNKRLQSGNHKGSHFVNCMHNGQNLTVPLTDKQYAEAGDNFCAEVRIAEKGEKYITQTDSSELNGQGEPVTPKGTEIELSVTIGRFVAWTPKEVQSEIAKVKAQQVLATM